VVAAGFPVVATSSAAVARAIGREDHEVMTAAEAFGALARIAAAVDVPVTADIESGYGLEAGDLVERLLAAGAVGLNLEDTDHRAGAIRSIDEAAARIAAVRAAADRAGVPIVINARVDAFVAAPDDLGRLDEAIERGRRYLAAGADCTYPILLADPRAIERYRSETGGPVNILLRPGAPAIDELARLGVARVSMGSFLHRAALQRVRELLDVLRAGRTDGVWQAGG
jgi:2-methylisocitrate lyase-like PEP mutase family enzyme